MQDAAEVAGALPLLGVAGAAAGAEVLAAGVAQFLEQQTGKSEEILQKRCVFTTCNKTFIAHISTETRKVALKQNMFFFSIPFLPPLA